MTNGGKRPGAGRKKGSKSAKTLEKEKVLAVLRERIMRSADSLFNAAKSAAIGNQYLYKIETRTEGKKKIRSKPILVESSVEIEDYIDRLDRENRGEDVDDDEDVYYFISTKEPNIQAYKELMDRAFGRAGESIDVTSGGKPIVVQISHELAHKRGITPNSVQDGK